MREAVLKLKLSKYAFLRWLQYLGHLISGEGKYPLKEKLETILNLEHPRDVSETRHIIRLDSYYRKFVANFCDIIKPLTEPMKKNTTFSWNPHCKQSLDTIKEALTNNPNIGIHRPKWTSCLLYRYL